MGDYQMVISNTTWTKQHELAAHEDSDDVKIPKKKTNASLPWIEKYRPNVVEDLVVDEILLKRINNIIEKKNMPNIILSGVPGVGKTTTIYCIAKHLLGKYMPRYMSEVNASDERGIKSVQEHIVNFCKMKVIIPDDSNEYAKHKIIFLDEADNMTPKAQQLICILMGKYPNTRFAFTCNNSSDIIESIQSKCTILRYKKLRPQMIKDKLQNICHEEDLEYTDDGLTELSIDANGDMRCAINNLQMISNAFGSITKETLRQICDKPPLDEVKNIIISCSENDLAQALQTTNKLVSNGYSRVDIIFSMLNVLKLIKLKLTEDQRMRYLKELSQSYTTLRKGYDNNIQLNGCIISLVKSNN